ncbi:MAG: LacI family DNA-binding transcriptional regulator [Dongiaceae bacterium]
MAEQPGRQAGALHPARRTTIRDIARAVGVSPMTVSNVINDRPGAVGAETRARVEQEIERQGYRPQSAGRSLRRAERLSIGLLILDDAPTYLADPFTTQVVAGLSNHLSEHGYGLLLQGMPPAAVGRSPLIRDLRTDGICAMLSGSDAVRRACLDTLASLGEPVLLFQETLRPPPAADFCRIRQDDRGGGRMLGETVLAAGAERLLMLVPQLHWPAIGERIAGVRQAMRAAGGSASLRIVRCAESEFGAIQAALAADLDAAGEPEAILAGNDQIGIAALKLMRARGRRVPRDVLITGFNAFDFWQYTDPVLTTVRSPAYEIGARGGEEILQRLRVGSFSDPDLVFPVALQRGGST